MPSKDFSDLIPVLAVPILTAALGGLGLMVKDARRKKDLEHRCKTRLEMAALEVQFLTNWMQVRKPLGDSSGAIQEAEAWLDRCYRSADAVIRDAAQRPQLSRLRRVLLLQPLEGRTAQTLRICYWGAFLLLNAITVLGLRKAVQWLAPGGESANGNDSLAILIILTGTAVIASTLRRAALTTDDQVRNPLPFPPDTWPSPAAGRNSRNNWVSLFVVLAILSILAAIASFLGYQSAAPR